MMANQRLALIGHVAYFGTLLSTVDTRPIINYEMPQNKGIAQSEQYTNILFSILNEQSDFDLT